MDTRLLLCVAVLTGLTLGQNCGDLPDTCVCRNGAVTCHRLTAFPDELPDDTEEFNLDESTVTSIPVLNYPTVKELVITNANVSTIISGAFSMMVDLRVLVISSTKLSVLTPDMFTDIEGVTELNLDNNKLEELPKEIFTKFPKLEKLNLDFNSMLTLTTTTFEFVSEELREFSCIECGLETLPPFDNMVNLLTLKLNRNSFPYLHNNPFGVMKRLRDLELDSCLIETIEKDAFVGLEELNLLYLGNNQIGALDKDTFTNLLALQKLSLENNRLQTLSKELLAWDHIDAIELGGNKWRCDCDVQWMTHLPPKDRLKPLCSWPEVYAGTPVVNVTSSFECIISDNSSAIALGIAIPIIIICVIIIIYFIYKMIDAKKRKEGQRKSVRYSAVYHDTTEAKAGPPSRPTSEL